MTIRSLLGEAALVLAGAAFWLTLTATVGLPNRDPRPVVAAGSAQAPEGVSRSVP